MSSPSASTPQSSRSIQAFVGVDVKNKEERNVEGWRKRQWVTERELCCWLCLSRQVQTYWRNLNIGLCARVCACVVKSFTNSNNDREPLHEDMSEFSNTKERRVLFSKHAGMLHMPRLLVSVYVGNNEILIHWENLRMFFLERWKLLGQYLEIQ